jgi:hypothetical protein
MKSPWVIKLAISVVATLLAVCGSAMADGERPIDETLFAQSGRWAFYTPELVRQ